MGNYLRKHHQRVNSVNVLVIVLYQNLHEIKIPLLYGSRHAFPKWKIPGGRSRSHEAPNQTGEREIREEFGLQLNQKDMYFFNRYEQIASRSSARQNDIPASYMQYVFAAEVHDIQKMCSSTLDGEEYLTIELFSWREVTQALATNRILRDREILPMHARILNDFIEKTNL